MAQIYSIHGHTSRYLTDFWLFDNGKNSGELSIQLQGETETTGKMFLFITER